MLLTAARAAAGARMRVAASVPRAAPATTATPAVVPRRGLRASSTANAKVVMCLYEAGAAAKEQPKLLGCVENELGLRKWLESNGHTLVTTSNKEPIGSSTIDKELVDAEVVITTPFWPAYITAERIAKAPKLKLCLTAGIGSDHVDLHAANKRNITVAEVTGCNVVSVAEHVVMQILALVRNYMPAYQQVLDGKWNIAEIAKNAYDLEGKSVGTVAAGRIGYRVLERLAPFNCKELLYTDIHRLSPEQEKKVGARFVSLDELVSRCDVVTVNCPLHDHTKGLFNDALLKKMKKGSYLVNTARGAIVDRDALVRAIESNHLAGYAGDVWFPQPAPKDHPWRRMKNHAMTPHYSGTTLDAQARYAAGVKTILGQFFASQPIDAVNVICANGSFSGTGAHSYVQK